MNRGLARQQIFFVRQDGEFFESLLADGYERLAIQVHAYCLMSNHFHLLVHCPSGGLSEYMQRLSSEYTRHHNRRVGRDGPLFRGRFLSLPIESDSYLHSAGRYIHRNPLDIRPPVKLAEYRWSSLRNYSDSVVAPPWLKLSLAEGHRGPAEYLRYVESDDVAERAGSVGWAIATAIAECGAEVMHRPRVDRTIALLMLDEADERVAAELDQILSFASPDAQRRAGRRAHQRREEDRVLGEVALRALRLAS